MLLPSETKTAIFEHIGQRLHPITLDYVFSPSSSIVRIYPNSLPTESELAQPDPNWFMPLYCNEKSPIDQIVYKLKLSWKANGLRIVSIQNGLPSLVSQILAIGTFESKFDCLDNLVR